MLVHFVCIGNTYRSRLAEALLNSHGLPDLRAASSGIRAAENLNGPVSWYALRLLKNAGLIPYMAPHWTQTTPEALAGCDLVVFMEEACLRFCETECHFARRSYEIWEVPDVNDPRFPEQQAPPGDELAVMAITERTFRRLKAEVAALVERVRMQPAPPRTGAGSRG